VWLTRWVQCVPPFFALSLSYLQLTTLSKRSTWHAGWVRTCNGSRDGDYEGGVRPVGFCKAEVDVSDCVLNKEVRMLKRGRGSASAYEASAAYASGRNRAYPPSVRFQTRDCRCAR
jgi:hypothetical protein